MKEFIEIVDFFGKIFFLTFLIVFIIYYFLDKLVAKIIKN